MDCDGFVIISIYLYMCGHARLRVTVGQFFFHICAFLLFSLRASFSELRNAFLAIFGELSEPVGGLCFFGLKKVFSYVDKF